MVKKNQTVLVLDFGAQYSRLIARRVRELDVYSQIVSYAIKADEIKKLKPKGLILSGGPASVYSKNALKCDKEIFNLGIPILGICYGMQLLALELGGKVSHTGKSEYGKADLKIKNESLLFSNLPKQTDVWMSHKDSVRKTPLGFESTASTSISKIAAIENNSKKLFGVQFHPEVAHTPLGTEIMKNFLYKACRTDKNWTMKSIIKEAIQDIKDQVKDGNAICGLSGGVDSAAAAVLVKEAISEKLTCVFVDHGLLRKDEGKQVKETFAKHFKIKLVAVDAKKRFFQKLKGVTDPEEKRVVIGREFIKVFEEQAKKVKDAKYLVQGTLYPDVIESGGTKDSVKIKTHHNVGALPKDMKLKLIEPLRLLFKDEVRKVGLKLGLPDEIVWRHPFPGPGLAVRIIGEVTQERVSILQKADAIVEEEIKSAGLYRDIWQAFAILPCIKSVGVMGDERTYSYPIAIRAVSSEDAMTADWVRLPYKVLESISSRIINEVKEVNRVVYDISSKPPSTIEWE